MSSDLPQSEETVVDPTLAPRGRGLDDSAIAGDVACDWVIDS